MSVDETKSKITASIWQSIAQSGVPVTTIPQDQLNALVNAIADGVLRGFDEMTDQAGLPARQGALQAASPLASEERILWEGRPFLSLVQWYQITTDRVRIVRGLLSKDRDDIELVRIQDIDHDQGITERILGIGDIVIRSSDNSLPEVVLSNVSDPEEVHEILRRAMLDARRRYRYSVQEEM